MNRALAHRGPDGEGSLLHSHAMLAMRRLSIIDVLGGAQPLYNEDRTVAVIANGEIYNFVELRQQLASRGHHFSSRSDCETIVHLYEQDGPDCVLSLRGMFAFALLDFRRNRLVLARDRLGEKPLYLWERDGCLAFSSELRSLIRSGIVPFELDPAAINQYFHYCYVPEPRTAIVGVRKLPAAHRLVIELDSWQKTEEPYWALSDAPALVGNPADVLREELETVARLVVRSDVPVGIALSGGLDSSAIAALVSKTYPNTLQAFSVGYEGPQSVDESRVAERFANELGLPFHRVEIGSTEMVSSFPRLVEQRDDPIADISGYGYYLVMRAAHEAGVPVMLQGQGGDELFWGYPWVRTALAESRRKDCLEREGWRALTEYVQPRLPAALSPRRLLQWASEGAGVFSGIARYSRDLETPPERLVFYDATPEYIEAVQVTPKLYASRFLERIADHDPASPFTIPRPWPKLEILFTELIISTYLRENGIAQADRLSMASSVELRLPLVDYRLLETVVGLRKAHDDSRLPPKTWLKESVRDLLPEWLIRRPKQGFSPPVGEWHRSLFAEYGKMLRDGFLVKNGILTATAADQLSSGPFPRTGGAPFSFRALVLEVWCRGMLANSE